MDAGVPAFCWHACLVEIRWTSHNVDPASCRLPPGNEDSIMPTFNTEVSHQLGQEPATARLKHFMEQVREQYKDFVTDLQGNWIDNILTFSLKTYGFKIDGTLTVDDKAVRLAGNLPLAAIVFRGKIEQSIASELRRELSSGDGRKWPISFEQSWSSLARKSRWQVTV